MAAADVAASSAAAEAPRLPAATAGAAAGSAAGLLVAGIAHPAHQVAIEGRGSVGREVLASLVPVSHLQTRAVSWLPGAGRESRALWLGSARPWRNSLSPDLSAVFCASGMPNSKCAAGVLIGMSSQAPVKLIAARCAPPPGGASRSPTPRTSASFSFHTLHGRPHCVTTPAPPPLQPAARYCWPRAAAAPRARTSPPPPPPARCARSAPPG